ncbi:CPBP family intramembrane glutamic endopeptidase [Dethiothermospora halolimnae]|uniref:CPBP family intramembrane glutamic endopeptidase n=1 Tax=Dethiothermospora halolimnae TaxID=3114390 RepID=UPI003CCC438D
MISIDHKLKQSTLFKKSTTNSFEYKILTIIIIYFVLWLAGLYAGRIVADTIGNIFTIGFHINSSLVHGLKRFITCGVQILIFFVWVHFVEKRPIKTMGFEVSTPIKFYLIGVVVVFAAILAITTVLIALGMIEIDSFNMNVDLLTFMWIILGWLVQSASEEIAIRGWLIPILGNRYTPFLAILLTSTIFGILHLFSSGVTILSFINLFLSGIFFASYAIYTNNIWGVCGMHFSWNLTLGNIFGLPVSGFNSNGETIITMKQTGPVFFTGGDFGPEGSFITTIVLLIGICIIGIMTSKKYKTYTIPHSMGPHD